MKTIKYMIIAAMVGTVFFTGCKKDNNMGTAAYETTLIGKNVASINYQLRPLLPPAAVNLVKWDKGYFSANAIIFNGILNNGQMLREIQYGTKIGKTFDLFGTTSLGIVKVPDNIFANASFEILISPINQTNSFALSGTFTFMNATQTGPTLQSIPVLVISSDPITLTSVWVRNAIINQPAYSATLLLDMGQLTNGIDATMLENAQITDGTIVISSNSNANLYSIIIGNLKSNMLQVAFSAEPIAVNAAGEVNTP